ncbi:hypothetical protein OAF87_02320 [Akkermansiaceae bacterium]|nr:hypothetical protein [Akkermansiaceae bacterium]MDB4288000.1 hypothetical protein [bacterium]MDA7517944.1 hypothetical protein [Akkermansiaceae bacterium]MDB4275542.1 hypothetical protein [Akkermansiaceae bacterium]MDB4301517.1 hypothetical protein [Akkermansiaceae bacterium]
MKKTILRTAPLSVIAALAATMGVSCTTTYDQQGRATQQVSPGGALLGAAAVGLIGYNIAKNRHKNDNKPAYYGNRGYNNNQGYRDQCGRGQRGHYGY